MTVSRLFLLYFIYKLFFIFIRYNGAVADKWNRAHLLIKQQRQYDPSIFPQVELQRDNILRKMVQSLFFFFFFCIQNLAGNKPESAVSAAIIDVRGSSSNSTDLGVIIFQ
jgi:hypothetical protein